MAHIRERENIGESRVGSSKCHDSVGLALHLSANDETDEIIARNEWKNSQKRHTTTMMTGRCRRRRKARGDTFRNAVTHKDLFLRSRAATATTLFDLCFFVTQRRICRKLPRFVRSKTSQRFRTRAQFGQKGNGVSYRFSSRAKARRVSEEVALVEKEMARETKRTRRSYLSLSLFFLAYNRFAERESKHSRLQFEK